MARAVRLYAHRGAAIELPENTMPAFERAVEIGVDALEMDGHLTRDGHVVVSHDPSGVRMCGVDAMIRDCSVDEVQSWDAGCKFRDRNGDAATSSFTVPTFDEVLTRFRDIIINLDLKQHTSSMVAATLEIIRAHDAEDRVILASFDAKTLLDVRRAGYSGKTALPRAELLAFLAMPRWAFRQLPLRGEAAQLPTRIGPLEFGNRYIINKCHDVGIRADYWTVNDPDEGARLLALGADGIMTDDPAALMPVFDAFRAKST